MFGLPDVQTIWCAGFVQINEAAEYWNPVVLAEVDNFRQCGCKRANLVPGCPDLPPGAVNVVNKTQSCIRTV